MAVPLVLPDPDEARLENSPLRLVVCQVRHSRTVGVSDAGLVVEIQRRIGEQYPDASPYEQQEVIFTAGPGGANANTRQGQQGWQFKSEDGTWTLTLQTDFFSIETSDYHDWTDFRERFEALLGGVAQVYSPKLEQRIGLRYVDEIERPDLSTPHEWRGSIADDILGPVADPALGPAVRVAQQVLELEGPGGTRGLLRHSCEPFPGSKPGSVYRLDHDCFRQRSRPFDVAEVLGTVDELHRLALQLFQRAITPAMYASLRGDGVSE